MAAYPFTNFYLKNKYEWYLKMIWAISQAILKILNNNSNEVIKYLKSIAMNGNFPSVY